MKKKVKIKVEIDKVKEIKEIARTQIGTHNLHTRIHKSKKKYNRKIKHKRRLYDEKI